MGRVTSVSKILEEFLSYHYCQSQDQFFVWFVLLRPFINILEPWRKVITIPGVIRKAPSGEKSNLLKYLVAPSSTNNLFAFSFSMFDFSLSSVTGSVFFFSRRCFDTLCNRLPRAASYINNDLMENGLMSSTHLEGKNNKDFNIVNSVPFDDSIRSEKQTWAIGEGIPSDY